MYYEWTCGRSACKGCNEPDFHNFSVQELTIKLASSCIIVNANRRMKKLSRPGNEATIKPAVVVIESAWMKTEIVFVELYSIQTCCAIVTGMSCQNQLFMRQHE